MCNLRKREVALLALPALTTLCHFVNSILDTSFQSFHYIEVWFRRFNPKKTQAFSPSFSSGCSSAFEAHLGLMVFFLPIWGSDPSSTLRFEIVVVSRQWMESDWIMCSCIYMDTMNDVKYHKVLSNHCNDYKRSCLSAGRVLWHRHTMRFLDLCCRSK